MSTYQHNCNSDFRNEGWTLNGSGVNNVWNAWSSTDDTKYCSNPSNKGRACVKFPVDISSGSIPDGSAIESMTVFIRAKKTDSGSRSVTVNVLCSDDTSHFTQRTVYLSTDITTQEIATYTKDPLGKPWTKDRINRLMVQCFSYCGASDRVRVYEVYAVVNYRAKPVVKVTDPSGSVDSASPGIGWTYTQADGDPQAFAEYKLYTAAQQEAVGFNPDTTPALYPASSTYTVVAGDSLYKIAATKLGDGNLWPQIYAASSLRSGNPNLIYPGEVVTIPGVASILGDRTALTALPFALAQNDYYIYVRATSTRHARSDWANRAFTVAAGSGVPGVPGGSLGGVGTGGGGGFESVIADSTTSNAYLTLRDGSNLLGAQMADFESLVDSLGYSATNATLSQDTTVNYGIGGASLKMVATAGGDMSASTSYMEIQPNVTITARVQFLSAVTSRSVAVNVLFFDSGFNPVAGTITASGTDLASTWTEVVATGTTPNTTDTLYYQLQPYIVGASASEVHNVDHLGVMYGSGSAWSNGGHANRNLLTSAQASADDPVVTEPWTSPSGSTYSRVATSGVGSEGTKAFKMQYAGVSPSINFVATGTAFTDTSTGTGYTLNKPAGVVDGDILIAYVSSNAGRTLSPPTGWTLVDAVDSGSSSPSTLSVLMRDGLAADPSSWTGNLSSSATRKRAVVVAYRGAAATALQFPPENVGSSTSGSTTIVSSSVNNSDPGAWRLSAFAVRDDAASGSLTANITQPSAPPNISYVGKASAYKDTSSATAYTINRPAGVIQGDLMVASLGVSGNVTVSAPSGWTLVRTIHATGSNAHTIGILIRTAGASEPTSWSATHTSTGKPKVVQCVAYRGAADASLQFIAEDSATGQSANLVSHSVTNTDSKAWRISVFTVSSNGGSTMTSNEVSERADDTNSGSTPGITVAVYDSNGTISTGAQQRSATSSNSNEINSGSAWIGIIKPSSVATSPGANETERQDATAGGSTPWVTLAAYDSNGVAATGNTTVYGSFTPGSGTTVNSSCSWLGFLIPNAPTVGGEVSALLSDYVDISAVSDDVTSRAGNQITVKCSFLGSTSGTPHLKLYSYVGNELLSTQVVEGSSFNSTTWVNSSQNFVLPQGTTRLKLGVTAADRSIGDYVLFDRALIAYGADVAWRPGTGRTAHPIFNVPTIEYAEDKGDGYGDWQELPGTASALLQYDNLSGLCTFVDQTIIPLSSRKYRARTISYGLAGDIFISGYGPESQEVTLVGEEWWLKDVSVPDNSMKIKVLATSPLKVATNDTSAVFQPLGADRPIVVTEGYKGDIIPLTIIVDRLDYAKLRAIFNSRRTMYLQSNIDNAWWVRPNGDISTALQLTSSMTTKPLRFVDIQFVEVDPEA